MKPKLIFFFLLAVTWVLSPAAAFAWKGDVNDDGQVDLTDAVLALQILSGMEPPSTVVVQHDVDGDERIGIDGVIYVLQTIAGFRRFVNIDFDDLPGGTIINNAYAQDGVTFRTQGPYPDGTDPGGVPIGVNPDYNAYVYNEPDRAGSLPNVVGGRTVPIPVPEHTLSSGRMTAVAEFTLPVDAVSIFGTGDAFQVTAYDETGKSIGLFSSPGPDQFPEAGYVREILPRDTGGTRIKSIEFGGWDGHFAYFDDLTFQRY